MSARDAADLAAVLDADDPVARLARLRLDAAVRRQMGQQMSIPKATLIGSPLRDAAVHPRPGDNLPPINAGLVDPHGPLMVSVEVDGRHEEMRPRLAAAEGAGR